MNEDQISWLPKSADYFDHPEFFFHPIKPEEYAHYGIDPQDVPMGTFAAKDHPTLLPSRFGGNAYGLGIIELSALNRVDTDFLDNLDFRDLTEIGVHAKRLNSIYRRLSLLIRFTSTGMPYFLIPINLVAHSLQDIKIKADHIEALVLQHIQETQTERLNIGLMTAENDVLVHELTARFSNHRIFIFDSINKLRSWRTQLDVLILPKDFFEYLSEQKFRQGLEVPWTHRRLLQYSRYLSGKVYDLLETNGKFLVAAHYLCPRESSFYHVRFSTDEERKSFLLFSHIFKTKRKYKSETTKDGAEVYPSDLCYYLKQFALSDLHLNRLLGGRKPSELSIDEIDTLPYLNFQLPPQYYTANLKNRWKWILDPYFETIYLEQKALNHSYPYREGSLELDRNLPESLLLFVGKQRQPAVTLSALEKEVKASGMMGCSLALVAEYRNTFRYVLDVLKTLDRIRNHDFSKLPELELNRLRNPFEWPDTRNEGFDAILLLLRQISILDKLHAYLNPDKIEGQTTPILDNIDKMALHGFTPAQLREILLIVVGHTTMSRIVFGKLPAKTLGAITDKARKGHFQEIVDLLRFCRLMSLTEMAAAFGDSFTVEHGKELFLLYRNAIQVATDFGMNWEKLHDLRISMLGGVQNKAIREMMKFFNLFEFLNTWQEFENKGPCQKEVLCDYDSGKVEHLSEALILAHIAAQFKQQFSGNDIFGKSYFFRQFLDTEFHGTGHLFPKLGSRAGFVVLWIAVNVSERHIVNFNPMLAGIPQDRHESRIAKIREIVTRISIERLEPQFFEEIKEILASGRPAFIFDSGIRLMNNPETRAVDVAFVDVDENIDQLETLITRFESSKLQGISLKDFQDMERLFSELESFHYYLREKGCSLCCDMFGPSGSIEGKSREIRKKEERLSSIFRREVLIPEEIYDTLRVLAVHCPEILRFILPEFHALGNLMENWPTRQKQSLGAYAMRCLQKFQALITKDREAFQDPNTFYQLAKKEFGSLAEEGIGANHPQMETLENLVDRIRQRPVLYQAFTPALLFQDIGKIKKYVKAYPGLCVYCTHAEQGAAILEESEILETYGLDSQVRQLIVLLVRHHGLIGHVIQGEEPVTFLENCTAPHDDRLLDAFVLHSILAASAVQEGLMICDLLDLFLYYRGVALRIIKSRSGWHMWLKDVLREKGHAVLSDFQTIPRKHDVCPQEKIHHYESVEEEDEALWRGRQIGAFERLLRLMGVMWVDYQDLQMYQLSMPVNFIYHKKRLKSVGLRAFEKQLETAAELLEIVSSLKCGSCYYFLHCLDTLGGSFRIYDFNPLAGFLKLEECVNLLMFSFRAFHHYFGNDVKGGLISFRSLSQSIEQNSFALQSIVGDASFIRGCADEQEFLEVLNRYEDLSFQVSSHELALGLELKDPVQFSLMVESLKSVNTHDELNHCYQELMEELKKLPYKTADYQKELHKAFKRQKKKINDQILKAFQELLNGVTNFAHFRKVRDEIRAEQSKVGFSEEQQLFLKEIFEYHQTRIREHYLDGIFERINHSSSPEEILDYWNGLKYELLSYRSYVGKEYESLIAEFIDQRLAKMP